MDKVISIKIQNLGKNDFYFSLNSFIENDFYIDLKHSFDTNQINMIDYTNYIQNEDEHVLMKYIKKVNNSVFLLFFLSFF